MDGAALLQSGCAVFKVTAAYRQFHRFCGNTAAKMNGSGKVIAILCPAADEAAVRHSHVGAGPHSRIIIAIPVVDRAAFLTGPAVDKLRVGKLYTGHITLNRPSGPVACSGRTLVEFTACHLQSRCTDETGYVQPTIKALVEQRGTNGPLASIYHLNGIQSWKVASTGEVTNVHHY